MSDPVTAFQVFSIFCGPQLFDHPCQPLIPTFSYIQLNRVGVCEVYYTGWHDEGCDCGGWYSQTTKLSLFIDKLIFLNHTYFAGSN